MLWAFRAHARAKVQWRMSLLTFDQHAVTPHLTDTNNASAAALGVLLPAPITSCVTYSACHPSQHGARADRVHEQSSPQP